MALMAPRGLLPQDVEELNAMPGQVPGYGLLPQPDQSQGLLGRLTQNPGFWQGLSQAGAGLVAASQGAPGVKPTWARGLSAGLSGFESGMQSYADRIAKERAAALDEQVKMAQAQRAAEGDALKYQFGAGVLTEQGGVKGFAIPVQNPQTGAIESKFVPVGDTIVSRSTGLSPQAQAELDALVAGDKRKQELLAELGLTSQIAESKGQIAGAEAAGGEAGRQKAQTATQAEGAAGMLGVLDRIEEVLPTASRSKVSGGLRALGAEFLNTSDEATIADKRLELLGSELISEQARSKILGPNPSEGDRVLYERLAGQIQNPGPLDVRMAAVDEMRRRFMRTASRGGAAPKPQTVNKDALRDKYGLKKP